MLIQGQIQALNAPFPAESLSSDTGRGFELTSIKAAQAQAVVKGLNEVFDACGIGWRYAHSPFEELHADSGRSGSPAARREPSPSPGGPPGPPS